MRLMNVLITASIVMLLVVSPNAAWRANASESVAMQAEEILKATGVRGGLAVHLDCGNGELTCALAEMASFLIDALDRSQENVDALRERFSSSNGRVHVDRWNGRYLPYVDNLVNLIVIGDMGSEIRDTRHAIRDEELIRVLAPRGRIIAPAGTRIPQPASRIGNGFVMYTKPVPSDIDEWTHALYDATGNAVSHDRITGPPARLQWVAAPFNTRSHDVLASISAVVTSGGRLFYIIDESTPAVIGLPPRWNLVARDAFNGVLLWKKQIGPWQSHLHRFRQGPPELGRRLVADPDALYATLSLDAPVTALDPATGEIIRTYQGTERTEEILFSEGTLFVVTGDPEPNQSGEAKPNRGGPLLPFPRGGANKRILAFNAAGGKVLWKKADQDSESLLPMTTAIDSARIVFQNSGAIVCANRENGKTLWRVPQSTPDYRHGWSSPTLLVHDGVVLSADRLADPGDVQDYYGKDRAPGLFARWGFVFGGPGRLVALSLEDGKQLWQAPCAEGFNSPIDVFVARGLVWSGQTPGRYGATADYTEGRNLRTGKVEKRLKTDEAFTSTHHHRCYRDRIVDNYLIMGRTGIEFIDLDSGECLRHNWVRGVCQYGVVPANGLLYAPPHACACYIESMLHGFYALAPAGESRVRSQESRAEDRLERGPAYGFALDSRRSTLDPCWPTYRHDAARSGRATTAVPAGLEITWRTKLGSDLGSPVIAGGLVFIPAVDAGAIHALDAASGAVRWTFRADGRIDSPPTIYRGLALFGTAGGWVYCLRAADGELVWRFRAAPEDKHAIAFDRVESLWPVHGNILVHRDTLYSTAGRSSYLDGGMYFYQLDPTSGKVLSQRVVFDRDPESGRQPEERIYWLDMPGALSDILSADGDSIYMRQNRYAAAGVQPMPIGKKPFPVDADQSFNLVKDTPPARWSELYQRKGGRHLYSPGGFLDGSWYHRAYWIYGNRFTPGWAGWHKARGYVPAGRILAMDETNVYGYGEVGPKFQLFSVSKQLRRAGKPAANSSRPQPRAPAKSQGSMKRSSDLGVKRNWVTPSPMQVRGIVATDELLFVAGHPDFLEGDVKAIRLMRQAELGNAEVSRQLQDQLAAWDGVKGGLLHAVSCSTGELKAELQLDSPPVWDGMAAANGHLFLSTKDGSVLCLGGE